MDEVFHLKAPFQPTGDQPQAIAELAERIENGENDVVLMGADAAGRHWLRQDVYDGEHHRPVQSPDADFGAE